MKKIVAVFVLFFALNLQAQKIPAVMKTEFTAKALTQKLLNQDGKKLSVKEIFAKHPKKIILIDFWASWCRDCILALPKTKELLERFPNLDVVYFSVDRSEDQWKKGLEKYGISDKENYFFEEGWKNEFTNTIDLNWVPRFILVDSTGKIAHYYATSPSDEALIKSIEELLK